MSDVEFRAYERAVNEGEIDAIPKLITCALRTSTPIHSYLPVINANLNQDVIKTLEGSELMDLRLYRVHSIHEAAAILERSGRVLPSLELLALTHQITGIAGREESNILLKECLVEISIHYFVRATPIFRLAKGQRAQTPDEIFASLDFYEQQAAAQSARAPHTQAITKLTLDDCADYPQLSNISASFLTDQAIRIDLDIFEDEVGTAPIEQPIVLKRIAENIECESRPLPLNGALMIPTVNPRAEYILGNPNVFEFPE